MSSVAATVAPCGAAKAFGMRRQTPATRPVPDAVDRHATRPAPASTARAAAPTVTSRHRTLPMRGDNTRGVPPVQEMPDLVDGRHQPRVRPRAAAALAEPRIHVGVLAQIPPPAPDVRQKGLLDP